jgi:hypothetical protein
MVRITISPGENIPPFEVTFTSPAPLLVSQRVAREIANMLRRMENQIGYLSDSSRDVSNVMLNGQERWR